MPKINDIDQFTRWAVNQMLHIWYKKCGTGDYGFFAVTEESEKETAMGEVDINCCRWTEMLTRLDMLRRAAARSNSRQFNELCSEIMHSILTRFVSHPETLSFSLREESIPRSGRRRWGNGKQRLAQAQAVIDLMVQLRNETGIESGNVTLVSEVSVAKRKMKKKAPEDTSACIYYVF